MLWFYVSSLAILVGAELNAVVEHARRDAGHSTLDEDEPMVPGARE
jgi:uncharacterized BrkB/YihY/UPF0761 family membrane protein